MKIAGLLHFGRRACSPIGIDMGATSIKMVQLQRTAAGWAIRDMMVKDIDLSNDDNSVSRKNALIQTIKECMKESSFSGRSVISVMPGYQLDIFPVKLTLSDEKSLEEAILEEASAHLSYDVANAVIDYLPVEDGESAPEKNRRKRFLLIAARREDVDEILSVLKGAKLKPAALDISACALARVISFSGASMDNNALIINAGELHTTLTVLWKDTLLFERNNLWGRDNMVESLMNRLRLDREKAIGLLGRVGLHPLHSSERSEESAKTRHANKISEAVYEIVATPLEKLAKEIDKVLQYVSSEMRGAAIDVIYLMGTAGTIKNMDTYLEKRTGIRTLYFNPLRSLPTGRNRALKDDTSYRSFFGVPLGLAMRGLENNHMTTGRM